MSILQPMLFQITWKRSNCKVEGENWRKQRKQKTARLRSRTLRQNILTPLSFPLHHAALAIGAARNALIWQQHRICEIHEDWRFQSKFQKFISFPPGEHSKFWVKSASSIGPRYPEKKFQLNWPPWPETIPLLEHSEPLVNYWKLF